MLGPAGDTVLRAMGLVPAGKGIISPEDMPAAVTAVEAAIAHDESCRDRARTAAAGEDSSSSERDEVFLRQRAWPLVEMMKRAHAENEPIVWGV